MAKERHSNDIDVPALCDAIGRARQAMVRPRLTILQMAKEVAGHLWSEESAQKEVVVNLLSIYQSIITRSLVPKNPRFLLSTFRPSIKPTVNAMQSWVNTQVQHIRLSNTLRRIAVNGLYSFGITKVSLADPAMAAAAAWNLRAGEPNVWSIDPDDYVCDIHARDFSEFGFEGHGYRVPFDAVKDSKLYAKWARTKLTPSTDPPFDAQGVERLSTMGRTFIGGDQEEFMPMIDLWEIYCPRQRKVLTLADDQITGPLAGDNRNEPLREQTWIGPERGPFIKLGFQIIPGNWMPKGPMQDLYKLHMMHNNAMRKLSRTINDRLKEVTLVRQGASQVAEAAIAANDGDVIDVADPTAVTQIVMGGQHAQLLLAMATSFKDLFSFSGGNIELLGGRSPQSKTATQDRMLDENANLGIADLQDQMIDFTSDVGDSLCWYWWHDPRLIMRAKHSLPGLPDLETILRVYPAGYRNQQGQAPRLQRSGRFEDLDIKVDPYSLQRSSPQKKLQDLNNVVQTIILPMMQLLVQQGKSFDVDAYLQKVSQWMDQPDLADIITIQEPPEADAQQGLGDKPPMPNSTNREYTRTNVSQRTPQSDNQQLIAQMLGHNMGGAHTNGQPQGAGV